MAAKLSEHRRLLRDTLIEHPGRWLTFNEIAKVWGFEPTSKPGRALAKMIDRMYRAGEIQRREITDEEIAERGAPGMTVWLWGVA